MGLSWSEPYLTGYMDPFQVIRRRVEESEMMAARRDHEETVRQLNAAREALQTEQENLRRAEAEVELLQELGEETSTIISMYVKIAEDRQRMTDELKKINSEYEKALLEQTAVFEKFSEEYTEEKKKNSDTHDKLQENQAVIIRQQKTMPAVQSVRKVINTMKLVVKNAKKHSKNPKKLVEVVEKLQGELESQIMDVHSYMLEGHLTREAMTAFVDAAILDTQMVEILAIHGVVDSRAIEVTKELHQEEWQRAMTARRRFYPLTDPQTPELESIFNDRFETRSILLAYGLQNASSSAAAYQGPDKTNQPSRDEGLAANLEGLTIDMASSTPPASGERGFFQEGIGRQTIEKMVSNAAALLSVLEEGLENGRFDKEGDAAEHQATTAALDDFPVLHEDISRN